MRILKAAVGLILLLVLYPGTAGALRTGGPVVVIPVAMHGPGAESTEWRTDLWISNWSSLSRSIEVTYYPEGGGAPMTFTVPMAARETVEIVDVVQSRFGLGNSKGLLLLSTDEDSSFEARARIYNTGNPNGEFGQFVPGIGVIWLSGQSYLPGISGIDGNRTNAGIANPADQDLDVQLRLADSEGTDLVSRRTVTVPARSVVQINDIFAYLETAPRGNAQLEMKASSGVIYGYASVVRSGTGDAIFIFGTSPNY